MNRQLNKFCEECIELIDKIYDLALSEEFDRIQEDITLIVKKINLIMSKINQSEEKIILQLLSKVERLFRAVMVKDSISILDITRYEIVPLLQKSMESAGESAL